LVEVRPLAAFLAQEPVALGSEFQDAFAGLGWSERTLWQRFTRLLMLWPFAVLLGAALAVALSLTLIVPIAIAITVAMPITPAVAFIPLVVAEALPAVVFLWSLLTLLALLTLTGGRASLRGCFAACLCGLG
jgi:hypothetical protein